MPLDSRLLDVLACPADKGPLHYFEAESFLYCSDCRRRYEIHDDIPDLLIDEATVLAEAEADALVERAEREGIRLTFSDGGTPLAAP